MADTELEQHIEGLIRREGPVTFARFMEMALYRVPGGYYTSGEQLIGPQGDFYTSPLAHPAFGALIAVQLGEMWERLDAPSPFFVVEMGSGKGALAEDILTYSRHLSEGFLGALRYVTVERTQASRKRGWDAIASEGLPLRHLAGCILSNELLDAMPVHRVVQREGALREIYVGLVDGDLAQVIDEPSTPRLKQRLDSLGVALEEGQEAEVNLLLEHWVQEISTSLDRGYVISIDYGYPAKELYSPSRPRGTLMCHYRHTANRNPFLRVGRQDMTAHVDFSSVIALGEKHGLRACGMVSQARFLANLGLRAFPERLRSLGLPSGEYHANMMGIRNLIDPEGLGNFRVLIQGKGQASEGLRGLCPQDPEGRGRPSKGRNLPVPTLTPHHIDLLRGKYPHMAWSPEE